MKSSRKRCPKYVTTEEYSKGELLWLVFMQRDTTKIANHKQLEKDLNLLKDEKISLDVE